MTRRAADWSIVHHSSDPVPADQYDVGRVAKVYRSRGDDLASARSTLSQLSQLDGWTGEAAEEFAKKASERTEDLGKAAEKYLEVADALDTFAGHVETARDNTWDALQRAIEAENERKKLDNDPLAGVDDPTPEQLAARMDQWDKRAEYASARGKAAGDVEEALEVLSGKAEQCASDIRDASEKFSDGWWDDVKGWVRDHADLIKMIVEVLKWVAVAVAAIGIIVALFFTAPFWLTALLVGAGIALAVAILAGDALLLSVGEATWGDIAWDTAGVVLSVIGGRATLQAARQLPGVLGNARNAVVATQQQIARNGLPQNVKNALNITSARGAGLRRWADRQLTQALSTAANNVDDALRVRPDWVTRVRHLDTELATVTERLRVLAGYGVNGASDSIDIARQLVKNTVVMNWVGLSTAVDESLGQIGIPAPSDLPKFVIDEGLDELSDLRWRLSSIL